MFFDRDAARAQARALYPKFFQHGDPGLTAFIRPSAPATKTHIGKSLSPEVIGAMIELACEEVRAATEAPYSHRRQYQAVEVINALMRQRPSIPPERAAAILDVVSSIGESFGHWLPTPSLLRLVSSPPTPREVESLQRLRAHMSRGQTARPRKIVARIDEILAGPDRELRPGGTWSLRVLKDIAAMDPIRRDTWATLVEHLLTAGQGEPTRKWEKALRTSLDKVGEEEFVARTLEWIALGPIPGETDHLLVPERDADYLKGFVWALSAARGPSVARALADLADSCFRKVPNYGAVSHRVGNACIRVLARGEGMEPIAQLGRLRTRVKYAVGRQLVEKALAEASARAGITADELEEIAVPTFDLDATGARRHAIGFHVAHVRIAGSAGAADDIEITWAGSDGRRQRSVPAGVREQSAAALAALKKSVKDIAQLLPAQKARLERLLESDRVSTFEQWRARYAEHPLVGQMARRLIWRFSQGGGAQAASGVFHDGRVVGVDDAPIDWISSETAVQSWHPLGERPAVVRAWRQWLERHAVVQPFKQAHREVYALTDAERETSPSSNRFAGHILRQHQLAALCRERDWHYRLQGDRDSSSTPTRGLPRWGLEVQFLAEPPEDRATGVGESGVFQFVATGAVSFFCNRTPVPLSDVPPLAFTEAMRDIDLFVGVCSIGLDAAWGMREPVRFREYWQQFSFGDLSDTDVTRRAVLDTLIPRLKIADRLSLDDRFLVVRGDRAIYKIHLRSGNVLMEPGSRYLCIVPAAAAAARDIYLPFEGDRVLAVILSKAILLAADRKITDEYIRSQLAAYGAAPLNEQ